MLRSPLLSQASFCKELEKELEGLTDPKADEWIEKMYQARELLRDIRKNAPEELAYRLFEDFLDDAGKYL